MEITNVKEVLKERQSKYGNFSDNAQLTQKLYKALTLGYAAHMRNEVAETVHMVCHKISRAVVGDDWHEDNAVDIEGYAQLLVEHALEEGYHGIEISFGSDAIEARAVCGYINAQWHLRDSGFKSEHMDIFMAMVEDLAKIAWGSGKIGDYLEGVKMGAQRMRVAIQMHNENENENENADENN